MAEVILTFRIMPESVDIDLDKLGQEISEKIVTFGAEIGKLEQVPIAFGLKSINISFIMDEKLGSTDDLEETISNMETVASVEVIDVRRAIG